MNWDMGTVTLHVVLMLLFSGGCFELANAQPATTDENKAVLTAQNASDLLRQIDLLVQQNGRLEKLEKVGTRGGTDSVY